MARLLRIVRALAEASLVAVAFAAAILLIGTPIALLVQALHASLSWLGGLSGAMAADDRTLVAVASTVGGLGLAALFARALVGFFHWRAAKLRRVTSTVVRPGVPSGPEPAITAA